MILIHFRVHTNQLPGTYKHCQLQGYKGDLPTMTLFFLIEFAGAMYDIL